jgi:hypothetical protein
MSSETFIGGNTPAVDPSAVTPVSRSIRVSMSRRICAKAFGGVAQLGLQGFTCRTIIAGPSFHSFDSTLGSYRGATPATHPPSRGVLQHLLAVGAVLWKPAHYASVRGFQHVTCRRRHGSPPLISVIPAFHSSPERGGRVSDALPLCVRSAVLFRLWGPPSTSVCEPLKLSIAPVSTHSRRVPTVKSLGLNL